MEDLRDLRTMLNRLAKRLETDVRKLDARVDKLMKLPDIIELEHLVKTLAWAMDLGDKDRWLSIWSDDVHYTVPQYNIDLRGKKALAEFAEVSIFNREKRRFSSITNILAEVTGDTATARDYYMHYGYPINAETGEPSLERAFSEGMHYYKFRKADGIWKITDMEVYVHRRQEEGETK
jgi:ketosteroid isomerase-like protein